MEADDTNNISHEVSSVCLEPCPLGKWAEKNVLFGMKFIFDENKVYVNISLLLLLNQQQAKKKLRETLTCMEYLVVDNPETNLSTEYHLYLICRSF